MEKELIILNNWEKAKRAIAVCKDIDEVKQIRDRAEALRAYVKQAREGLEVQNNIADIKIRAERRIGEFSKELPLGKTGPNTKVIPHDGNKLDILKEAGIEHYERYESIASLPEKEFEKHIEEIKASNKELTTIGVIRLAKKLQPKVETPSLPKGKYNVIYADCPWRYWEGGLKNQSQHYPTMDLEDIKNLQIQDLASNNCILFIWATFPYIKEALEVIENWGFQYSTVGFTWVKSKKNGTGFAFGCGGWTRANAEICLIATKGSIKRQDASISQIIYEPKEEHSKKPNIVREKIVQLVGDLPRIELFAREKTEGWDVWGLETDKFKNNDNK